MFDIATQVDQVYSRNVVRSRPSLSDFTYENGYYISFTDLGSRGVKVALSHANQDTAAIILPAEEVRLCCSWLLWTLGQNNQDPLTELASVLKRLARQTGNKADLERGDKTKIRSALKFLKASQPQTRHPE